jgi:hypothetical protein
LRTIDRGALASSSPCRPRRAPLPVSFERADHGTLEAGPMRFSDPRDAHER